MVRVKHRYLLVHILRPSASGPGAPQRELPAVVKFSPPTPDYIDPRTLIRLVRDQVSLVFGDYGAAVAGSTLKINYFSNATSTFIIRAPRDHFRLVWAALAYVTSLPSSSKSAGAEAGLPCVMRVVRVSGTIRKAEEEVVRRARAAISKAQINSTEDTLLDAAIFKSGSSSRENIVDRHSDAAEMESDSGTGTSEPG